jgi:hypothetical protein
VNGNWHDELEAAPTVEEAVASMKRYLGSIPDAELGTLSRHFAPKRIQSDEDIDDLTLKLAKARREAAHSWNDAVVDEVFELSLHASLRISQLNRQRASGRVTLAWRPQMSQMS